MAKKAKAAKRAAKKPAKAAKTAAKQTPGARRATPRTPPLRYAHPFFTNTPVAQRQTSTATGTRSMADYAAGKLGIIPPPSRDPTMQLQEIIGQPGVDEIEAAGAIRLHLVGDTGRPGGDTTEQEEVATAMTADYTVDAGGNNPALMVHLGDVIYGHDKAKLYRDEFYRPYMKYPGKIIAIPGNHDGETFKGSDPVSLLEFRNNFCAPTATVPSIAGDVRIFRETMTQPGVYWMLSAPFVNVIGLYSNIAEGPGNLLGANNDKQQITWLTKTLTALKASGDRRALVIATHHPPYSSGGHSSSKEMLAQLDAICNAAGVVPHAMLAGHAHNYQRYTRQTTLAKSAVEIPYFVVGCGGHAASAVDTAHGQKVGEAVFEKSLKGFGYATLTADAHTLRIDMTQTTGGVKTPFDTATVDLATRKVT